MSENLEERVANLEKITEFLLREHEKFYERVVKGLLLAPFTGAKMIWRLIKGD